MVTDRNVPPLPPDISMKEAKAYLSALIKGDADSIAIIKASTKKIWENWFPPSAKPQV